VCIKNEYLSLDNVKLNVELFYFISYIIIADTDYSSTNNKKGHVPTFYVFWNVYYYRILYLTSKYKACIVIQYVNKNMEFLLIKLFTISMFFFFCCQLKNIVSLIYMIYIGNPKIYNYKLYILIYIFVLNYHNIPKN
jgi:hypothetical protein